MGLAKIQSSSNVQRSLAIKSARKTVKDVVSSFFFLAAFMIFVWLLVGTIFFHETMDWNTSQSFYFACNSGLSIGFGADIVNLGTASDGVHIFTVFFVLIGSSFIAAALAIFIESVLDKQEQYYKDMRHKGTTTDMNNKINQIYMQTRSHATAAITFVLFFIWIAAGVIFGVYYLDFSFSVALAYAVTGLSTAGLVAPDPTRTSMWFTGWWVLFGVPIYAFALGQLAGIIVEYRAKRAFKQGIKSKITEEEFSFAMQMEDGDDGEVDWAEFLQMSLLRVGKISEGELSDIKDRFKELDVDGDGKFSKMEMHLALAFDKWDKDGSGTLDIDEWVGLCEDLNKRYHIFQSVADMEAAFRSVDDGDGAVSREELGTLWKQHHLS